MDSLELSYSGSHHQRIPEAVEARDVFLSTLGFTSVSYAPSPTLELDTYVRAAQPYPILGYILTRYVDARNHVVAFIFTEDPPESSGKIVWLDVDWLARSINAQVALAGYVYPMFYVGLPSDLRMELTLMCSQARRERKGLWKADVSLTGARLLDWHDLRNYAMFPKLFRRLTSFFKAHRSIEEFDSWLREHPSRDDKVWIISRGEQVHLHNNVMLEKNVIRLRFQPEDLIFT